MGIAAKTSRSMFVLKETCILERRPSLCKRLREFESGYPHLQCVSLYSLAVYYLTPDFEYFFRWMLAGSEHTKRYLAPGKKNRSKNENCEDFKSLCFSFSRPSYLAKQQLNHTLV